MHGGRAAHFTHFSVVVLLRADVPDHTWGPHVRSSHHFAAPSQPLWISAVYIEFSNRFDDAFCGAMVEDNLSGWHTAAATK